MPAFDIVKSTTADRTFRVMSIVGKYDMKDETAREQFVGELNLDFDWNIGVITGNSGTGKSIIAKELFPNNYIDKFTYSASSIMDDMPKRCSVTEICKAFNAVGFSSPPSWLKPYSVLSTGEKMRVDIARALLEERDLIVFDEFTSTVDRNVAKIGSYAISRAIKRLNKQFIAVTCHNDILDWLEADWVFNTNSMEFTKKNDLSHPLNSKFIRQTGRLGEPLKNIII